MREGAVGHGCGDADSIECPAAAVGRTHELPLAGLRKAE